MIHIGGGGVDLLKNVHNREGAKPEKNEPGA